MFSKITLVNGSDVRPGMVLVGSFGDTVATGPVEGVAIVRTPLNLIAQGVL